MMRKALSYVADTKPGELEADFWLKIIGFGAGPLLGCWQRSSRK